MKGNFNQAAAEDITLRTMDQNSAFPCMLRVVGLCSTVISNAVVPEEGADDDLFGDMGFGPEALRTAGTPASNAASSARVDDADLLDVGMPDVASLVSGASGASAASKRRSNAAAEAAAAIRARTSLASAPVRDSMGAPADEFGMLGGADDEDAFGGEMPMMDMEAASDDELLAGGDADLLGSVRDTDGTSGISELVESETESQAEAAADAAARAADKRKARRRRAAGAVRDEVISIPSRVLKGWIGNTERHLLPRPLGRRRTRLARQIAKADHAGLVNTEEGFTQLLQVPMGLRHDMVAPQLLQLFAAHASDNLPYARRTELELKNEIRGVLGLELFDENGGTMEMPPAVDDLPSDDDGGFMPMGDMDEEDGGLLPMLDADVPAGRPSLLDAAFARGADSASVAASAISAPSSTGMASTAEARLGARSESDSQITTDESGTVPVHKWHSRTKRMARVLADALQANAASVNDPMDAQASFSSLAMGSSKRSAASAFYEVLALATWDVVSVQQTAPFSDIAVGRTANFDSTMAAVNA